MKKQEAREKMVKDLQWQVDYHAEQLEEKKAKLRVVKGSPEPMDRDEVLIYIDSCLSKVNFDSYEFARLMNELVEREQKIK